MPAAIDLLKTKRISPLRATVSIRPLLPFLELAIIILASVHVLSVCASAQLPSPVKVICLTYEDILPATALRLLLNTSKVELACFNFDNTYDKVYEIFTSPHNGVLFVTPHPALLFNVTTIIPWARDIVVLIMLEVKSMFSEPPR